MLTVLALVIEPDARAVTRGGLLHSERDASSFYVLMVCVDQSRENVLFDL